MDILKYLATDRILTDGGMGTMQMALQLPQGDCPEALNLSHPDAIASIHRAYTQAGAQTATTNTFGCTTLKLTARHCADQLEAFVEAGVALAKQSGASAIALSLGPTGVFVAPYGPVNPMAMRDAFLPACQIGRRCGADWAMIETMCSLTEARLAMAAAKEAQLPFVVSFTFETSGYTLMGDTPEACAAVAEAMGAWAIGINCSSGPEELLPVVKAMRAATALPLIVQPNAGLPIMKDGQTVYPLDPNVFSERMMPLMQCGIDGMGGCCGTTPQHIAALHNILGQLSPQRPERIPRICNRKAAVSLTEAQQHAEELSLTGLSDPSEMTDVLLDLEPAEDCLAVIIDCANVSAAFLDEALPEAQDMVEYPLLFRCTSEEQCQSILIHYTGVTAIDGPIALDQRQYWGAYPL